MIIKDGEDIKVPISLILSEMVPGIKEVNVSVRSQECGIDWIGKVAHQISWKGSKKVNFTALI